MDPKIEKDKKNTTLHFFLLSKFSWPFLEVALLLRCYCRLEQGRLKTKCSLAERRVVFLSGESDQGPR